MGAFTIAFRLSAIISILMMQAVSTGSIAGVVTDNLTGKPIAGAQVSYMSSLDPPNPFNGPNPNPAVTTDSNGAFTFTELKAASYQIMVSSNGYTRQWFGQQAANGKGQTLYLSDGQLIKNADVALVPTAVVSGQILTGSGLPAVGIPVHLARAVYGPSGMRSFQGAGTGIVDDRGQFRIFGVAPGRYYFVAGDVSVTEPPGPGGGDSIVIELSGTKYGVAFYPGVANLDSAAKLDLKPGSETHINLTVPAQRHGYRVSGRVVDAATGQPVTARTAIGDMFFVNTLQPLFNIQNSSATPGAFEFLNVPPGTWQLHSDTRVPPFSQPVKSFQQEYKTIEVSNQNVDDVVVRVGSGTTIRGRIYLEDGTAATSLANLASVDLIGSIPLPGVISASSRPDTNGAFQLSEVYAGEYEVDVRRLPPGYYVRSARYAADEILNSKLQISGASSEALDILLRSGAPQISGTVVGAQSKPVPGIQVVLVPQPPLRRQERLYKTAITDRNGAFTMTSISPGDYKLFSWAAMDTNGYFDPDVMKESDSLGANIHVEESVDQSVQVNLIPARDR